MMYASTCVTLRPRFKINQNQRNMLYVGTYKSGERKQEKVGQCWPRLPHLNYVQPIFTSLLRGETYVDRCRRLINANKSLKPRNAINYIRY